MNHQAENISVHNLVCVENQMHPSMLFRLYYDHNLITSERSERIEQFIDIAIDNWNKALRSQENILRELSYQPDETNDWASLTAWRFGLNAYHFQCWVSSKGKQGTLGALITLFNQISRFSGNHLRWLYSPDTAKLSEHLFGSETVNKSN